MAIALASVSIVHARRVRLVFTNTVAAGAFASLSFYGVTSINALGSSPSVVAALALLSSPNVVELQLSIDLAPGGTYEFSAVGVPASDLSTTPNPSTAVASFGQAPALAAPPQGDVTDADAWIYGVDLAYSDADFLEDAAGDLAERSGPPLVRLDLTNRALSDGLPWDKAYGLKSRSFIDGTPGAALELRGRAVAQMLEDDRVASADASIDTSSNDGNAYLVIAPKLIGAAELAGIEPIRKALVT